MVQVESENQVADHRNFFLVKVEGQRLESVKYVCMLQTEVNSMLRTI